MATAFRILPLTHSQLSLDAVLRCGQSFRWTCYPLVNDASGSTHEWRSCTRDRVLCLRQTPSAVLYRAVYPDGMDSPERDSDTLALLRDYFQLDIDLEKLYDGFAKRDPVFSAIRHRFSGIRILRQDPWETLVSFICSANNNISRITKMVHNLAHHYSPPLLSLPDPSCPSKEIHYHPFPHPSDLAVPGVSSQLRALGFGYRAEYIQKTAQMLVEHHGTHRTDEDSREAAEKWLYTLRSLSTDAAREELLKFMGVGRKVADCIALMSLDKHEVVPVDTHVHQIASKHYNFKKGKANASMSPKLYSDVALRLTQVWGDYAGWAHSVMFTADLKAFIAYGLDKTDQTKEQVKLLAEVTEISRVSESLPSPKTSTTPAKRKLVQSVMQVDRISAASDTRGTPKRRRRTED